MDKDSCNLKSFSETCMKLFEKKTYLLPTLYIMQKINFRVRIWNAMNLKRQVLLTIEQSKRNMTKSTLTLDSAFQLSQDEIRYEQ